MALLFFQVMPSFLAMLLLLALLSYMSMHFFLVLPPLLAMQCVAPLLLMIIQFLTF